MNEPAIQWVDGTREAQMAPAAAAALMQRVVEAHPDQPSFRLRLGRALYKLRKYSEAAETLEKAAALDPGAFGDWAAIADCYLRMDRPDTALAACERGLGIEGESALLCLKLGTALRKLGRAKEARTQFERCVALGDHKLFGLQELLRPLARDPDGGPLLAFCESLPDRLAQTALVRANRAIALSRLGRTEEAGALIDLNRNLACVSIEPPAEFGSVEAFNAALATEILNPTGDIADERDLEIAYEPGLARRPALDALHARIRAAIEAYLDQGPRYGLDTALPPRPRRASLFHGFTILRRDGSNGEHIHQGAYVSSVYYVRVPESIAQADDARGSLTLGGCEHYTAGYRPCWGSRRLKPVAGMLVLFPAHIFHDVLPSRTDEPRISVAADLMPEHG